MSDLKIYTNYHERDIVYGYELTNKEKDEFDYYSGDDLDYATFFRYKENVYDLSEFMRTKHFGDYWHGYSSDSFFSGVLVHLCDDGDHVVVGWYCS